MLEGLDQVPWASLTHAYGSASDVPGLLRDLAWGGPEQREEALDDLCQSIWHQGTVYEASAYAVPFLLELVQSPSVGERDQILALLANLAQGNSYLEVHGPLSEEMRRQPNYAEDLAREQEGVKQARAAVEEGLPIYLSLLEAPEPEVRMAAADTLADFPERSAQISPVLQACLERETDAPARASLQECLSALSESEPDTAQ